MIRNFVVLLLRKKQRSRWRRISEEKITDLLTNKEHQKICKVIIELENEYHAFEGAVGSAKKAEEIEKLLQNKDLATGLIGHMINLLKNEFECEEE